MGDARMISASSDWIAVPLDERAQLSAEGWAQHSESKRPVKKRGRHTLQVVAIMWRARVAPRGDLGME